MIKLGTKILITVSNLFFPYLKDWMELLSKLRMPWLPQSNFPCIPFDLQRQICAPSKTVPFSKISLRCVDNDFAILSLPMIRKISSKLQLKAHYNAARIHRPLQVLATKEQTLHISNNVKLYKIEYLPNDRFLSCNAATVALEASWSACKSFTWLSKLIWR